MWCRDSYSQSVTVSVQRALFQVITAWGEPLCIFPSVFQKAVVCITLQVQVEKKYFVAVLILLFFFFRVLKLAVSMSHFTY